MTEIKTREEILKESIGEIRYRITGGVIISQLLWAMRQSQSEAVRVALEILAEQTTLTPNSDLTKCAIDTESITDLHQSIINKLK